MEAMENITLSRTQGDTDRIILILEVRTESGLDFVDDAAAVTMHIKTVPVTTIAATAKGTGVGIFYVPTTTIVDLCGTFDYEVQVNDGASEYTIARGILICNPEIT